MTGHTPGPWRALSEKLIDDKWHSMGDGPSVWAGTSSTSHKIARVCRFHTTGRDDVAEANARLMAAAPDLATFYIEFRETAREMVQANSPASELLDRIDVALAFTENGEER